MECMGEMYGQQYYYFGERERDIVVGRGKQEHKGGSARNTK